MKIHYPIIIFLLLFAQNGFSQTPINIQQCAITKQFICKEKDCGAATQVSNMFTSITSPSGTKSYTLSICNNNNCTNYPSSKVSHDSSIVYTAEFTYGSAKSDGLIKITMIINNESGNCTATEILWYL